MGDQTWLRIRVATCAWAYEYYNEPLISDAEYDKLAERIDTSEETARPDLDRWFRKNYKSHTGSWVHAHPELPRLDELTRNLLVNKYLDSLLPPIKNRQYHTKEKSLQ